MMRTATNTNNSAALPLDDIFAMPLPIDYLLPATLTLSPLLAAACHATTRVVCR